MSTSESLRPVGITPDLGLIPGEPVAQFELGTMQNFVYLLLDWKDRRAMIVDPQKDIDTPLRALGAERFTLEGCLLTHTHHDHVAGLVPLLERLSRLPIYAHSADLFRLEKLPPGTDIRPLRDSDEIRLGHLRMTALHTPGHSAGEVSYFLDGTPPRLLTGDTLFIRDCGRTDFATGSNEEMFQSLQRLKTLPPETVILPGHHYAPEFSSVLREELLTSPPLRCQSVDELKKLP